MARSYFWSFLWLFFSLSALLAQMPYYGPSKPSSGVQVQLMVYDQPDLDGLKIESVTFNGTDVALQPPDLYGFRGGGGFLLNPGKFQLEWTVSKDKMDWPRTLNYKQTVEITPRDTWVQVTIKGDKATVL